MTPLAYLALTSALVLACSLVALVSLYRARRRIRAREIAARARR